MKQQATGGATREAVKEYLQQYHMARERRRILERRHDVLARELKAPAPGSAYMTMPASHSAAESEGAVSVVFRLSEVEERIEAQRIAMGRAVTMSCCGTFRTHKRNLWRSWRKSTSTKNTAKQTRITRTTGPPMRWRISAGYMMTD